jgi:hypothetical protein
MENSPYESVRVARSTVTRLGISIFRQRMRIASLS